MSTVFNSFCSISSGPNIAFIVVSFTSDQLYTTPEDIFNGVRQAIRHAVTDLGLDHTRVTFLIPPGVSPSWKHFFGLRAKLGHLKFEFPSNGIALECVPTANFMSMADRFTAQCMCLSLGVTWCAPLSRS